MFDYMEEIRTHIKNKLNKLVKHITIVKKFPKPCTYCGYGKLIVGNAQITNEVSNSSENSDSCEIQFTYDTGCMTYSSEMDYAEV